MTNQEMIELEPEILKRCEERILFKDHLSRLVVKERWSNESQGSVTFERNTLIGNGQKTNEEKPFDYSVRTYGLKHRAVHSAKICIYEDSVDEELIKLSISDVACWIWSYFFRDELLKLIQNRMVVRDLSEVSDYKKVELTRIISSSAKRVNIFGKTVQQFVTVKSAIGIKYILNRKYKRAAEQVIFFHPDIAHFQFLDPDKWIGEIHWRNIPDSEANPDGKIGFYRLVTTAAAKPVFPDFGLVVTVVPKGLRGFVYYWAWKLLRFVP